MAWILDLDGVVWLADTPIPGSAAAIDRLRARGETVRFLTNNSSMTTAQYAEKLERLGVHAEPGELLTSAQAASTLVSPGERVLVCGGPGVVEAVEARRATPVREGDAEVVIVGWHRDFDFDRLAAASRAIRNGARFVATNDDATYPTPEGPLPGNGALVAAVATASGARPVVAGKPYDPMATLVRERLGEHLAASTLVGDRPDTDGRMARALGIRFALVFSGITARGALPVEPAPDVVADDLAALVPG